MKHRGPARLPRAVVGLGIVSFFTDLGSELIVPLLPAFLASLGAGATFLGLLEGAAMAAVALLRLVSGAVSDALPRRKPLIVAGYALSSIARPLVALAQAPWHVLCIRLADRTGKGIRSSPRDALVADVTPADVRGRAFGYQRAMDHAGALCGPLIAWVLLELCGVPLRGVFALAAIPGAIALAVLIVAVREVARAPAATPRARGARWAFGIPRTLALRRYLVVVAIFTLGNSSDLFLVMRASDLGVPLALLPILWATLHVARATLSIPLGALSDRLGRKPVLAIGLGVYALVYAGFALASEPWHAWALFAVYGVHDAFTEGAERALVADLAPANERGRAFGAFHLVCALAALPASLGFGVLWDAFGPGTAFATGAGLAVVAAAMLVVLVPGGRAAPTAA